MNTEKLKGIQKSKKQTYLEAVEAGKANGYLWLVRDFDENNVPTDSAIYFGDRLYAEKNQNTIYGNDFEIEGGEDDPSTPEEQKKTAEAIDEAVKNGGEVELETNVKKQTVIE